MTRDVWVIISGGSLQKSKRIQKALQGATTIIAADSGANTAVEFGINPSVVIGDLDSITKTVKDLLHRNGAQFLGMPTTLLSLPEGHTKALNASEKDQTDTELAIDYAVKNGANEILILGGITGDRFDHSIANIFLSTTYTIPIRFITSHQVIWTKKGPYQEKIYGEKGDTLSLIPLSAKVTGVTSQHLYYPLKNDSLFFGKPRGISNVLTKATANVSLKEGTLLFVHSTHEQED